MKNKIIALLLGVSIIFGAVPSLDAQIFRRLFQRIRARSAVQMRTSHFSAQEMVMMNNYDPCANMEYNDPCAGLNSVVMGMDIPVHGDVGGADVVPNAPFSPERRRIRIFNGRLIGALRANRQSRLQRRKIRIQNLEQRRSLINAELQRMDSCN